MKPGIYTVRGAIGPGKSEPVDVNVGSVVADAASRTPSDFELNRMCAWFNFRGVECVFAPRERSPHPERLRPAKMALDLQSTAKSIAAAAFRAAKEAAEEDARQAALAASDTGDDDLDSVVLGSIRNRSAGPQEGRHTKYGR